MSFVGSVEKAMVNRIRQWPINNSRVAIVTRLIRVLGIYKEIWYGAAVGVSIWMLDAVMHASQRGNQNWGTFKSEIIASDSAQLLFRALFVAVAVAFGVSLWRSNRRRRQVDDLHAAIDSLYQQIANPLLLIVGYCQMLSLKQGWPVRREAVEIVDEIHLNARRISEMIKRLPPPGAPIQEEPLNGLEVAEFGVDNRSYDAYRLDSSLSAASAAKKSRGSF